MTSAEAAADRARRIHDEAIIIDCRDPSFLLYRQTRDDKEAYWDTVAASGLTGILVDVPWTEDNFREASLNFASWHERVASHKSALIVENVGDIRRAKAEGKVGFILTSQTPTIMEDDVSLLTALHQQGLRVMQMSYQKRNLLADGCGERQDGGLSNLGVAAIREMNRLGIAIDLSHASDRTMVETIGQSERPVFFSHSNARSVVNHGRNVPDDYLRELADRGGVCGISAYSNFLVEGGGSKGSDLSDYLRMIDYVVALIGIDHVAMGFDVGEFRTVEEVAAISGGDPKRNHDPSTRYVKELMTRRNLPALTEALVRHGFDDASIRKFLGENVLRFFEQVWAPPQQATA